MMLFKDKTALITGASRGLGAAIAVKLGQAGATILGTATSEQGAHGIDAALEKFQVKGRGYQLDVTNEDMIQSVMEDIVQNYGTPLILINNAGITNDNIMLRMKEEEWESVINTNLNSIYRMTKSCLKGMVKARWGRIINISSVVGVTGNPGQSNYAAAKAGMIGFTKSLAQEIGSRGITVNIVAPGFIDTDMTRALQDSQKKLLLSKIPLQSLGQPDDIAQAVMFLASEAARYITGHTLHVNGGMYMA